MVVMMEVVDWRAIIVLLGMSKWLFGGGSEVRHVMLILGEAVAAMVVHGVDVHAVEAAMVVWTVIKMLSIVMLVMMVAVLPVAESIVAAQVTLVSVRI